MAAGRTVCIISAGDCLCTCAGMGRVVYQEPFVAVCCGCVLLCPACLLGRGFQRKFLKVSESFRVLVPLQWLPLYLLPRMLAMCVHRRMCIAEARSARAGGALQLGCAFEVV
jgi:hypothetical protein